MKTAAASLIALVASASAFTSTQVPSRSTTAVSAAMDNMVGSVDFRGKEFKWDPVGTCCVIGRRLLLKNRIQRTEWLTFVSSLPSS
jgi:hypothetical protein